MRQVATTLSVGRHSRQRKTRGYAINGRTISFFAKTEKWRFVVDLQHRCSTACALLHQGFWTLSHHGVPNPGEPARSLVPQFKDLQGGPEKQFVGTNGTPWVTGTGGSPMMDD